MVIENVELNKEVAILLASIEHDKKIIEQENNKNFSNEIKINDALHRIADIRY